MANGTHASHGLRHTWRGRRNTPARRARSASASCFLARPTRGVRPPPTHALTIAMPAPRQFFAAHITATAFVLHRFLRSLVCARSPPQYGLWVFASLRLCFSAFVRRPLHPPRMPPLTSYAEPRKLRNTYESRGHKLSAPGSRLFALFLKYCDSSTGEVRTLRVTVASLSPLLGRPQSREGRPMGSPHPPLDSLLTFSQTCLEGFEQSCLNRISNLRKEFREIFEERVQHEVGARVARWILDGRQTSDAALVPDRTVTSALLPAELAFPGHARGIFDAYQSSDANPFPDRTAAPALLSAELPIPSVARLGLDAFRASDANRVPIRTAVPPFAQLELAFSNLARGAAQLASSPNDPSASGFPPGPMLDLPASVGLEFRSPVRRMTVSLDASAALRSMEHSARCEPPSLGGSQNGPPNFVMPASAPRRRFLLSHRCSPLQLLRDTSSRISPTRAARHQTVSRIVHHASPLARCEHPAALDSVA